MPNVEQTKLNELYRLAVLCNTARIWQSKLDEKAQKLWQKSAGQLSRELAVLTDISADELGAIHQLARQQFEVNTNFDLLSPTPEETTHD